jgi:predicted RNase H-like nuclease
VSGRVWLAGVDGSRAGWVVALVRPEGDEVRICPARSLAELATDGPAVIAVDIPIGLPERIGPEGRGPEAAVRKLLKERQSSVFPVPSRAAVYAADYQQACSLALATSEPPRKVSRQLFALTAKIREVDNALRADPGFAARVFECHPELAFWRLNHDCPLALPKKVKGAAFDRGLALRRAVLIAAGFPAGMVAAAPPQGAAVDDVLDALACAAIARRIYAGAAEPFPRLPARDRFGLSMAIWA